MTDDNPSAFIAQLEHKIAVLTRLTEISTKLTGRVPLDNLLEIIMKATVEITDCDAASVLLWNNRTHELFFVASSSQSAHNLLGKPVPLDSIAGTALRENQIIQVDDAKSDPRHYSGVDQDIKFQTRSILTVPMVYRDRRIGVVQALNKRTLPWTEDDKHYLSVLAAQAAVAIEDAQMMMEMKRANEELSQLDKLKNDFIAIASHELRTPLGVILGYASFLQEDSDPLTQEHATKVVDSALQLRRIIDGMINLRYLKQNQTDLTLIETTLSELFQDIQYETITIADLARYQLSIIPPEQDAIVRVDRSRLAMVINNLLNNAINFTPAGGAIQISAHHRNEREVWIRVSDSGKGIEKDQLEKIFEEFYQVEDHMTRHVGGLGIGLSITKAIIESHGGRVWAESEGLGRGATFIIALPKLVKSVH